VRLKALWGEIEAKAEMDPEVVRRLKQWFGRYVRGFLSGDEYNDRNVNLKIRHTARVRLHSIRLARSLDLTEDEQRLAGAIGLLHDIGRFRQFRQYRTFDDRVSEDHALLGLRVIAEEGCLTGIGEAETDVILKAVGCHNKYTLPASEDDRTLLFSRLIRDADKLDILDIILRYYQVSETEPNPAIDFGLPATARYRKQFITDILANRRCNNSDMRSANDVKLMRLSWLYDLNFAYSILYARDRGYIDGIIRHLPDTPDIRRVRTHLNNYLESRSRGVAHGGTWSLDQQTIRVDSGC
jgi:hypothetical protein